MKRLGLTQAHPNYTHFPIMTGGLWSPHIVRQYYNIPYLGPSQQFITSAPDRHCLQSSWLSHTLYSFPVGPYYVDKGVAYGYHNNQLTYVDATNIKSVFLYTLLQLCEVLSSEDVVCVCMCT